MHAQPCRAVNICNLFFPKFIKLSREEIESYFYAKLTEYFQLTPPDLQITI